MTLSGQNFGPDAHIVVIGAGVMGPGIAHTFAMHGYRVTLCDVQDAMLQKGMASLKESLELRANLGLCTREQAADALSRVSASPMTPNAYADATLVIEAVTENENIKRTVFAEVFEACGPRTVIWSNTSTLNVFKLVEPDVLDRLVVAHWFAPPHILPLVEVLGPEDSNSPVRDETASILKSLGKTPVLLDSFAPGFVINRLLRALGREAFYLIESGVISVEALDVAVRASLAPRMQILGVMQRYDYTGLGLSLRNLQDPAMVDAPVDRAPRLLTERVEQGAVGIAEGRGFYDYGNRTPGELQEARDEELWKVVNSMPEHIFDPKPI
nr:3-hydroxyacyl-CoA dehydrogenase family protein [Pusillimonas sp. MFBS29]